MSHKVLNNIA